MQTHFYQNVLLSGYHQFVDTVAHLSLFLRMQFNVRAHFLSFVCMHAHVNFLCHIFHHTTQTEVHTENHLPGNCRRGVKARRKENRAKWCIFPCMHLCRNSCTYGGLFSKMMMPRCYKCVRDLILRKK